MCGIVAIVAQRAVYHDILDGLLILQHRGQDAAGVMTLDGQRLHLKKGNGLVRTVFSDSTETLPGNMGLGHVRYPTAGTDSSLEAQPFYVNTPYGMGLAHNGNLTHVDALKALLFKEGLRHINTDSDSEVLLNVLALALQKQAKSEPSVADIFDAVRTLNSLCKGAYAAVTVIADVGLLAFRDPYGIRPLILGERAGENGQAEYVVASESAVLHALGCTKFSDLNPGEAIFISKAGTLHRAQCAEQAILTPCVFEYIYLARPDSVMNGISVNESRLKLGEKLAQQIIQSNLYQDIDVVIPIPETARPAASSLAFTLGKPLREGFVKNHYLGRSFIMPGQNKRARAVQQKLSAIPQEFKNKCVLLVDDSIVRGTTSRHIIKMVRDAGAKKVYFASSAPMVLFPNVYGIDISRSDEFVAHHRTAEEVAQCIGADAVIYQTLDDLISALKSLNPNILQFETAIFDGHYVTTGVDDLYLKQIGGARLSCG